MLDLKDENIFLDCSLGLFFTLLDMPLYVLRKIVVSCHSMPQELNGMQRQLQHRVLLIKIKKKKYINRKTRTDDTKQKPL